MRLFLAMFTMLFFLACDKPTPTSDTHTETTDSEIPESKTVSDESGFAWQTETFADLGILRYQVPDFEKLTLKQKEYVYYLTQAGLAGRDIIYDQNYRHNLTIRRALEKMIENYKGDKSSRDYYDLETYAKRIWFANGIHHHYSMDKMLPDCTKEYFMEVANATEVKLSEEVINAIFDPNYDNKKVNLDESKGLVKGSATNFYDSNLAEKEIRDYYKSIKIKTDKPVWYGLNSKVVKGNDGKIIEKVWHAEGMYGSAIKEIMGWLEKAAGVAENEKQAKALLLLIEYYRTGDLKTWDAYNIAWVEATDGDIDYINGFIEVYNDPIGYKGSYESIVEIKDFEASKQMKVMADNAQWFEDNSTIAEEHKKKKVVGISYKVVSVAGESGDASPATPIGVNLPNSDWIREIGSKSVSLGNIISAYDEASGPGMLTEFAHDEEEVERIRKYGGLGDKLSTALHEVIGHASGKINKGIGTPKETLQSYASTLEEARADIVALYFIMDQKMVDMGLMESLDVAKAEYDGYITNGMMKQLVRIEVGKVIEESHMRNRQLISKWVFEKGAKNNVIEKVVRDGKTYFNITDYDKLRTLFGELLNELQRIKSEGDYEAGKALVENYGVQVDAAIHQEVLDRSGKLKLPPYKGFINPILVPETGEDGKITNIKVTYPDNFKEQMMFYARNFSFLPNVN
ncbi:dipeptidyl peptidase 3 [Saprospiraceae bacterium]|nr:dipeptidyl peptidase 3 [Saprospiraceae bacterium]MDG1436154.1 dihydrofolate reductase [Saprospiraceae bacterium]